MSLPGSSVAISDSAASPRGSERSGTLYFIGTSERGPITPVRVRSPKELDRRFGQDVSYGDIIPCGHRFFARGGREMVIRRDVGPSATYGTKTLANSVPATVVTLTTREPGAWSTQLKVAVEAGVTSGTVVVVLTINDVEVERSPELASKTELVDWESQYVTVASGAGTGLPAIASAAAFSAGDDDRASISTTTFQACLDSLPYDLGGGMLAAPAYRTDTHRQKIAAHCKDTFRWGLVDLTDTATVSTLTACVAAVTATQRKYIQPVAPNHKARVLNTVRTLPVSVDVAAAYAEADRQSKGYPRLAAAGKKRGVIDDSLGPVRAWGSDDLETLNDNGITVVRSIGGQTVIYGARSGSSRPGEEDAPGMRVVCQFARDAQAILDDAVFEPDTEAGDIVGDIAGLAVDYYGVGAIVGDSAADACRLTYDVETISGGVKRLVIAASVLPVGFIERIDFTIQKRY